jgi:hypothetical protein
VVIGNGWLEFLVNLIATDIITQADVALIDYAYVRATPGWLLVLLLPANWLVDCQGD